MESPGTASSPDTGAPAGDGLYGVRVEVDSSALARKELGSFDVADVAGNLTVVSIVEELYGTSAEGVQALRYSFAKRPAGKFPPPKFWSLLSVFSGATLITLFCFSILKPGLELGLPSWIFYLAFGLIFICSTAMELKRVGEFFVLSTANTVLTELEKNFGSHPIIDLPTGRLSTARGTIEPVLKAMPISRIAPAPDSPGTLTLNQSPQNEQKGSAHGEAN